MEEKVARLIECERILRRTRAEQWRLIAELNIDEHAAKDIAMALQQSPSNGEDLAKWATHVASVFPDVLDAMDAGVISERSARGMIDPTEDYREELAQKAVSKTLETAEGRSMQQLQRSVRGRPQRADPAEHARQAGEEAAGSQARAVRRGGQPGHAGLSSDGGDRAGDVHQGRSIGA